MKHQSILTQTKHLHGYIPTFGANPSIKYSCKRCGKESEVAEDLCKPSVSK